MTTQETLDAYVEEGGMSLVEAAEMMVDAGDLPEDTLECEGHEPGPDDPAGIAVYCDGSCRHHHLPRIVAEIDQMAADSTVVETELAPDDPNRPRSLSSRKPSRHSRGLKSRRKASRRR